MAGIAQCESVVSVRRRMRVKIPAAGSTTFAPVAQVAERLICNQLMGFRVAPGAPTVAVPTIGMSGMPVKHVSCGFNSHRPPWGVSSFRRAPALQAGGSRGRADPLHQVFCHSRMRGRYAPLKTERAAFNSLGWHHRGIV